MNNRVLLCLLLVGVMTLWQLVPSTCAADSKSKVLILVSKDFPDLDESKRISERQDFVETQIRILNSGLIRERARDKLSQRLPALDAAIKGVQIGNVGRSSILSVEVTANDSKLGAEYANAIADSYVEFKKEELAETSTSTIESLTKQAMKIREELKKASDRHLSLRQENDLVALQQSVELTKEEIRRLRSDALAARTETLIIQHFRQIAASNNIEITKQLLHDAGIRSVFQHESGSKAFGDGKLDEGILEKRIAANRLRQNVANSIAVTLSAEVGRAERTLGEIEVAKEDQVRLQKLYDLVLSRLKELDALADLPQEGVRILERAKE